MYTRSNAEVWRPAINSKVAIGGVAALVLVIILIVASFFIGQTLVYIAIILTALVSLAAFALLGYAALQIVQLVKDVRAEVDTLVGSAKETMTEVQGTARFVSDNIVDSYVRRIRVKLREIDSTRQLTTVRGGGYSLS